MGVHPPPLLTLVAMTGNVVVGLDPRLTGRAKAIGNPHECAGPGPLLMVFL